MKKKYHGAKAQPVFPKEVKFQKVGSGCKGLERDLAAKDNLGGIDNFMKHEAAKLSKQVKR